MGMAVEMIWNVQVHTGLLEEVIDSVENDIRSGARGKTLYCANPHSLVTAAKDGEFLSALRSADYLIPDGIGIVCASRLQSGVIRKRITGSDVFLALTDKLQKKGGYSYFFLGSTDDILRRMILHMQVRYPQVAVAGHFAPPFTTSFSDEDNELMITTINAADPSVLWLGMTAPKQEKWIMRHLHRLHVPVICAVGAAFDYFAETKKRAPDWMQNAGLEWLPRLLREPGRMWRRNFISTPLFMFHLIANKIGAASYKQRHHIDRPL
jgi:N-acetylglucosaminyldiphosphoundecaprenol N-acetyl-beta-D-mannosaminyltransferase